MFTGGGEYYPDAYQTFLSLTVNGPPAVYVRFERTSPWGEYQLNCYLHLKLQHKPKDATPQDYIHLPVQGRGIVESYGLKRLCHMANC
jgi:hypothetical protein